MSYVRWSSPGHPHAYDSSVYIYDCVNGGIECCCCFTTKAAHGTEEAIEEMVKHVEAHIANGDAVPDFVIPRLRARENFN